MRVAPVDRGGWIEYFYTLISNFHEMRLHWFHKAENKQLHSTPSLGVVAYQMLFSALGVGKLEEIGKFTSSQNEFFHKMRVAPVDRGGWVEYFHTLISNFHEMKLHWFHKAENKQLHSTPRLGVVAYEISFSVSNTNQKHIKMFEKNASVKMENWESEKSYSPHTPIFLTLYIFLSKCVLFFYPLSFLSLFFFFSFIFPMEFLPEILPPPRSLPLFSESHSFFFSRKFGIFWFSEFSVECVRGRKERAQHKQADRRGLWPKSPWRK